MVAQVPSTAVIDLVLFDICTIIKEVNGLYLFCFLLLKTHNNTLKDKMTL